LIPTTRNAGSLLEKYRKGETTVATKAAEQSGAISQKLAMPAAAVSDGGNDDVQRADERSRGETENLVRRRMNAPCRASPSRPSGNPQDTTRAVACGRRSPLSKPMSESIPGDCRGGELFQSKNQTNLLRGKGPRQAVLVEPEQLARSATSTKVIVVGRVNDAHLYRELTCRGVSEYSRSP
jgi:hypothetical protein